MKPADFIDRIAPAAVIDMMNTGILASLTIAQAILESNWGESGLTVKGNNLFGMKAKAGESYGLYATQEVIKGQAVTVQAKFAHYPSWAASIAAHSKLLAGAKRYKALVHETDYKKAVRAIYAAGYATDPKYPSKLQTIIETYKLYEYDRGVYELKVADADAIIKRLQRDYAAAKTVEERQEIGRLADVLRVASGRPAQNK